MVWLWEKHDLIWNQCDYTMLPSLGEFTFISKDYFVYISTGCFLVLVSSERQVRQEVNLPVESEEEKDTCKSGGESSTGPISCISWISLSSIWLVTTCCSTTAPVTGSVVMIIVSVSSSCIVKTLQINT